MKYRYLGRSGLAISRICLGTATFGQKDWGCDEAMSHSILDVFSENGGNFIDTSDQYAGTISEQIIGRWLVGKNRDDIVLATKCFFPTSPDINARGLSRKHILAACEASLKRLKSDFIDLYQAHEFDPHTPLEETLSAFHTLIQQGKVRYAGFSNWPAWVVVKASALSRELTLSPFISGQYIYNLLKRDIEAEVIPACLDSGVGILCWSPLSGGMLTAKYKESTEPPKDTRLGDRVDISHGRYSQWHAKSKPIVDLLQLISLKAEDSPSVIALSWLLSKKYVSAVIIGARTAVQCEQNIKAGALELPHNFVEELNAISVTPIPAPHDICNKLASEWYARIQ
jgi:aryl-alcohol dehydrogenase-like predicted oxidoreductase